MPGGSAGIAPPLAADERRPTPTDVARIKRRLETADADPRRGASTAPAPTFRTSVTEHIDIWKFWGEPDEVAAYVRPSGGTWHHEFQNMVTPDEFKGYGGILGNGEKLQLAATSLAFAGAHEAARDRACSRPRRRLARSDARKAKEEVQRELEAFYALHPEARPAAAATPP